ncbi:MAG: helix-turn-helix domain-containing protein [Solirubrobacteraceae bacterium]
MGERGRPPKPLDPDASSAARLGAELRTRREAQRLTQQALGDLVNYTAQHVSEVERAKGAATRPFIEAVDRALDAQGALLPLLDAALLERAALRAERTAARRAEADASLRWTAEDSEAGEDVDPTNRRGLLGIGAATALGSLGAVAAPTQAREIDPELPAHRAELLSIVGSHDAVFGPHAVLGAVQRELRRIAEHRSAARGELRAELLRIEARWAGFAAWLSEDAGQRRGRDAWTDRARWLAEEADDADMAAYLRSRQSQWAAQEHDARRAIDFAEAGLSVRGTSPQTRALCARQAALGHALSSDAPACERRLRDAYGLVKHADSPAPPWWSRRSVADHHVRAIEAHCWLVLQPARSIPVYESLLREWPRDLLRDGGLHRARLALACAGAGELDRARAEGRKAIAVARSTNSRVAARELRRLSETLSAT